MGERHDDELGRLLRQARPEPREGWRERARAAMATAQPRRPGGWLRWVPTAAGVGLVVAALALLPYSAGMPSVSGQTTLGTRSAYAAQGPETAAGGGEVRPRPMHTVQEHLRPYVERAESFVRSRHWDDPEMLMAAGVLAAEYRGDLSLLKEAAEKGGVAEWAAYAGAVVWLGPEYASSALWRGDPRDPESMRQVREKVEATGLPIALTEEEAAPVLKVLQAWERADPENALPAAIAVYYLHGLGRVEEAQTKWEHAGAQPQASLHVQETIWAMQRLLRSMGSSEWESVSRAFSLGFEVRRAVEDTARYSAQIASYEGRRAETEGRYEDAFVWWNATRALGRRLQESGDTAIEVLQGIAIEGVGAQDIWRWRPDRETGVEGGPLDDGRLYQGSGYGEFVSRYGEETARQVRDSLVRAKLWSMMMRDYWSRDREAMLAGHLRAGTFRGTSRWFGILLVVFLLVWACVSLLGRRVADQATGLSRLVGLAIGLVSLVPITVVNLLMWVAEDSLRSTTVQAVGLAAIALSLLFPIFVPLVIVRWTRHGDGRIRTVWRGNLRRVLPSVMVICAVVSLSARIAGMRSEKAWARDWHSQTEMERAVEAIGPEWHDPSVPPDAWRNEPPPEASSG